MHEFDTYLLWILEQERQRVLSKHLDRYAQLHQIKVSQPQRQLWPTVKSYLQALVLTVRALHTRLSLPHRMIRQDQPFSVRDSATPDLADTTQMHGTARHEEQSVAAGP
jgi:hypothetical protein